jgi:5'/3'-nucleotidase
MHILLTNDDGVDAPGLLALAEAMRAMADVSVLAPDHSWSASGHVKTLHRPLRVWPTSLADGIHAMTTDGAPSDCVALAILGMVERPIDLVVSGINPYANVGHDVTYSGTVTAAMEAVIAGLPALAVSLDSAEAPSSVEGFRTAADVACLLAKRALDDKLPQGVLLNINVPPRPRNELTGILLTRQGSRVYHDTLVRREDPRGRPYYWIGGEAPTGIPEEGTDSWALAEGYVSVTPLQLDLTAYRALEMLRGLTQSL